MIVTSTLVGARPKYNLMHNPLFNIPTRHDCLVVAIWCMFFSCISIAPGVVAARTLDFNRGWRFYQGEVDGAEQLAFDDMNWSTVRTPHDWAIAGPFNADEHGYAGKLPWRGIGWYRKWMTVAERDTGSQVYLDFDGVMSSPKVYVNGELAGEWDYGYTSFRVDITPYVRFGRANVVAVRVDNRRHGTRWYPGAGIYRNVRLTISPPVHLAHDGTMVTTPSITDEMAEVVVSNEIDSYLEIDQPVELEVSLLGPDGAESHSDVISAVVAGSNSKKVENRLSIANPDRWDVNHPTLYQCVTQLRVNDQVVERRETPFGIRDFQFTADDGFHLNGRRLQLQGVNLHHDLGALGAAFNTRAMQWRLEQLQDMGVNAIRTAHNPPAAELLDLCDEMGILVWDELFDKWDETADRFDGGPSFEEHMARHAASFVRRDRNHPSVIAWSIGNEILNQPDAPEGKSRERVAIARDEFRKHDSTRPIGLACHMPHTADSDILQPLDLVGWNYQQRYHNSRARYPQLPIIYSETASALSSRHQYRLPLATNKCEYGDDGQVSAFESLAAAWADVPEIEFDRLNRDSYLAGEFVWTGFDYLGEPTPFERSSRSSYFGILDLVGFPKDRYYLYRSVWRPDEPTLHIAPHWTWPGHEGRTVPVMVYTNGDSAELFLNGRSLGKRVKGTLPEQPVNLLEEARVETISSDAPQTIALPLNEVNPWFAESDAVAPGLVANLGTAEPLTSIAIEFPRESKHYTYTIETSTDAETWEPVVDATASREPQWGGVNEAIHRVDTQAQYLRIQFGQCAEGVVPAIAQLGVYSDPYESEYYAPTYRYRLRWNDVVYEPGELKVVAYKNSQPIAEQVVRTAGAVARLHAKPDRTQLNPDGLDMCHVTIEAVDSNGVHCPLADDEVCIAVNGPGSIAAVGNGDPTSLEPFQSERVRLFGGKAMLILTPDEGFGGAISVTASVEGIEPATITLDSSRP